MAVIDWNEVGRIGKDLVAQGIDPYTGAKMADKSDTTTDKPTPVTVPNNPPSPVSGTPGNDTYAPARDSVTAALAAPGGPITSGAVPGNPADKLAASQAASKKIGDATTASLTEAGETLKSTLGPALDAQAKATSVYGQAQAGAAAAVSFGPQITAAGDAKAKADEAVATMTQANATAQAADKARTGLATGLAGPTAANVDTALNKATNQIATNQIDINNMREVNFTDDPGSWLINHVIKIPWLESTNQSIGKDVGIVHAAVDAQTSAAKGQGDVTDAINAATLTQLAAVKGTQARNAANLATIQDQLKAVQTANGSYGTSNDAIRTGLSGNSEVQSEATGSAGVASRLPSASLEAIHLGYAGAQLDSGLDEVKAKTDLARAETLKMEETTENLEMYKTAADAVWQKLGYPNGFPGGPNAVKLLGPQGKASLIGVAGAMGQTGTEGSKFLDGIFGTNPSTALRDLKNIKAPLDQLPPGQQVLIQRIGELQDESQQYLLSTVGMQKNFGGNKPNPAQLTDAVDKLVAQKIKAQSSLIAPDAAGNKSIYATPMLNTLSNLQDSSGGKLGDTNPVLKSMVPMTVDQAGNAVDRPTDFNDIIAHAAALSDPKQGGKMSEAQAAKSVVEIAEKSMDANQSSLGFKSFAIPLPTAYNVQLKTGTIGETKTFDMRNPAQVMQAIQLSRATIASQKLRNEMLAPGGIPGGY